MTSKTLDPKFVLTLDRVLAAPVAKLWRCWTEPDLIRQWFCPKPWLVSEARIDLRPGGEFYTLMNGPDGERIPSLGVFLEVQPERLLVTTDAFRPGWRPNDQAFMVAEVRFAPEGEASTRYIARAMHWTEDAMRQHEEMGFHEGWNAAADQLEALAKTL
ncbi:SRPBCC family protein [Paracoccus lutimaris]|uniref:Uncharacterized protein YndB with AHSA1/START domain n=1 Tax=Paracoccus lutimaris TaxID=1490030 RepID=A0A368YQ76_9RHOB|nr:SRPBCC family protein [Paracoccus lutimaris]RCW81749.1 uncharacterized protein YndB with AHSA1/START domain [Paracoccus lutimaris]